MVSIPGLGEVVAGFLCIAAFCSFFDCTPVWKIEPLSPEEAEAAIDDYYDSMFSSILGEDEFEEMEEQEGQAQSETAGEVTSPEPPDPNKLHHIFDDPDHQFGPLLDKFGGDKVEALRAIQSAAQEYVEANNITGITGEFTVNVEGIDVTVSGNVIYGRFYIGTAFIP